MICQTPEFVVVTSPYLLYQIENGSTRAAQEVAAAFDKANIPQAVVTPTLAPNIFICLNVCIK